MEPDPDPRHSLLGWAALAAGPVLLAWAALAVRREWASWRARARRVRAGGLVFPAPRWWRARTDGAGGSVLLARADGTGGWSARLRPLPWDPRPLEEVLADAVARRGVLLDPESAALLPPGDFAAKAGPGAPEGARAEGTATDRDGGRLYYDAAVLRDGGSRSLVLCESESPVLGGLAEGPFFERALLGCRPAAGVAGSAPVDDAGTHVPEKGGCPRAPPALGSGPWTT